MGKGEPMDREGQIITKDVGKKVIIIASLSIESPERTMLPTSGPPLPNQDSRF